MASDNANDTTVNPSHHSGIRHQPGKLSTEKSFIRFVNTRKGKAISIAKDERKAKVVPGTRRRPIIQNPSTPMPNSTMTASNVSKVILNFSSPFQLAIGTLYINQAVPDAVE